MQGGQLSKPNLINYSEWVAEIERLRNERPETRGLTADELAEQYGMSKKRVLETVLAPLVKQGRIVVTRRKTYRSDGTVCWKPEYAVRAVGTEVSNAKATKGKAG